MPSNSSKNRRRPAARKRASARPPMARDVTGIVLLTLALMLTVAIASYHPDDPPGGSAGRVQNLLGPGGAWLAYFLIQFTFGRLGALAIPLLLAFAGLDLLQGRGMTLTRRTVLPLVTGTLLAVSGWAVVRHFLGRESLWERIGAIGYFFTHTLLDTLGRIGSAFVLASLILIWVTLVFRVRWREVGTAAGTATGWVLTGVKTMGAGLMIGLAAVPRFFRWLTDNVSSRWLQQRDGKKSKRPEPRVVKNGRKDVRPFAAEETTEEAAEEASAPSKPAVVKPPPKPRPAPRAERKADKDVPLAKDPSEYSLPPSDLLIPTSDEDIKELDEEMLHQQAELLEERLAEFGVEARVVAIHPGPVITRYDLKPAPGVKVSKISNLSDDLALSLSAHALRIIAPIPGQGAVGIEVPNPERSTVRLRDVVESEDFQKARGPLTIALGRTAQGDHLVVDLAKMPHLLIAGATGSGKSVCINTIIASLLMRNNPREVMIAMVDPKKLELSLYSELRRHHLLFLEELDEVIATTPGSAVKLLQSIVREMERRYDMLAEAGVRSIAEFNRKLERGQIQPDEEGELPQPLPYLVTIVDEMADLMMVAQREVEEPITRLAQMARAVGIHLVLATQRPSVDVITGVIKANFPTRIGFSVASRIDSRTILDRPGADALLGYGDGLYLSGTAPHPVRFHGALVTTEEVEQLVAHVHNQPMFIKPVTLQVPSEGGGPGSPGGMDEDRDELFEEAVRLVVRHQQGSVSLLQRRLKIGYSRAGRLLDQLEQAGVVGPFEGSKAREVLIDQDQLDAFLMGGE